MANNVRCSIMMKRSIYFMQQIFMSNPKQTPSLSVVTIKSHRTNII